mmetsp:Transcript_37863/g.95063  ORF Transcript_37863/g.95063 Transcript_37863/m.95063 type:complete len:203 (-) Transcript_37863:459-1067(-)
MRMSLRASSVNSSAVTEPLLSLSSSLNNRSGVHFLISSKSQRPFKKMHAFDSCLVIFSKSLRKQFAARSRCSRCLLTPIRAMSRVPKSTSNDLSSLDRWTGGTISLIICAMSSGVGGFSKFMNLIPACNSSRLNLPLPSTSKKMNTSLTRNLRYSIHSPTAQRMEVAICSAGVFSSESFVSQERWFFSHFPWNKNPSCLFAA